MIELEIGGHVIFVDQRGQERQALVTAIHGKEWHTEHGGEVGVNVVFVSNDEAQRDDYGRKTQRESSVVHRSAQSAGGNYWKLP